MAKVLVNDTSLSDIADAIREKNGTSETYKPSEMGDAVREISGAEDLSTELTQQASLITQLETVLAGKAGGGSGGANLETCTVTVSADHATNRFSSIGFTSIDENGKIIAQVATVSSNTTVVENVLCGSVLACVATSGLSGMYETNYVNASEMARGSAFLVCNITASGGGSTTIRVSTSSGPA